MLQLQPPTPFVLLYCAEEEAPKQRPSRRPFGPPVSDSLSEERIRPMVVLVEDEPSTQDIYRTILEFAGYEVVVVADGIEAVGLIREAMPDVVLMDINLPGQDGWEATKALKDDQRTRAIPVVGVSASAGPAFARRAERLGFHAYHAKPLSPTAVLEAVTGVLGSDGV